MNKRLAIILILAFGILLTLAIKVWHIAMFAEHALFWGIGMVVLAIAIAMLAGKRRIV